jgi:hypothetical protein
MNHVAISVPEERFLEYRAKLKAKGVKVAPIIDHDDSPMGYAPEFHDGVYIRSFYFQDPDGILLEFACWRRELAQPGDVGHEPKTASDRRSEARTNGAAVAGGSGGSSPQKDTERRPRSATTV